MVSDSSTLVHLQNATVQYEASPPVVALRDLDLTFNQGEYVAVTGPSGSGKSTLLNLLGLLDVPTSGELFMAGNPVASLSDTERTILRRHHIGFVFQSFNLIPFRTALGNVEVALAYKGFGKKDRRVMAETVVSRVGMSSRAHAFPSQLSGGERQRIAIARAIVVSPSLLLCDEPTGNLDSHNANAILKLLEEINDEGQTVIVVTHDNEVASRARRRVELCDGSVINDTRHCS